MKKKLVAGLATGIFIFGMSGIASASSSTFDSNSEGWTQLEIAQGTLNITNTFSVGYAPSGGNPGGYIWDNDFGPSGWSFGAPASYLGDKSSFVGGTVSFDLATSTSSPLSSISLFWLRSDTTLMIYTPTIDLTSAWTHYDIPLAPSSGWNATSLDSNGLALNNWWAPTLSDFTSSLSNLISVEVRGDWLNGEELSKLDNFNMNPVPVPSTMLLLGSGIAGLVGTRLRRKKK